MVWALVATSGKEENANSSSITITSTFDPTDDNLLVAVVSHRGSNGIVNPTGWTTAVQASDDNSGIYFKIAATEGVTPTYAWTGGTAAENSLILAEFSGNSTVAGTILNQTASNFDAGSTNFSPTGTTATLDSTGQLVVGGVNARGSFGGATPFVAWAGGYTRVNDVGGGDGGDMPSGMAFLALTASTAAQTSTGTWTTARTFRAGTIATFHGDGGAPPPGTIVPIIFHQASLRRS